MTPIVGEDGTIWHRIAVREPDGILRCLLTVAGRRLDRLEQTEFESIAELDAFLERLTSAGPDESTRP